MAGDWSKVRHTLPDDPRVIQMAHLLKLPDPDYVVGKLIRVWIYGDRHTTDGKIPFMREEDFDNLVARLPGFAAALREVGWLECNANSVTNVRSYAGLCLPRFDEHNGETAKKRALGRDRTQKHRTHNPPKHLPHSEIEVHQTSPNCNAPSVTREEKSIEKNIVTPPLPPTGGKADPSTKAPTADEFMAVWNTHTVFIACKAMSGNRLKHFKVRCKDPAWCAAWRDAFERAKKAPFPNGANDKGWRGNVDWFLRPDTVIKLLEGAYDFADPKHRRARGPTTGEKQVKEEALSAELAAFSPEQQEAAFSQWKGMGGSQKDALDVAVLSAWPFAKDNGTMMRFGRTLILCRREHQRRDG